MLTERRNREAVGDWVLVCVCAYRTYTLCNSGLSQMKVGVKFFGWWSKNGGLRLYSGGWFRALKPGDAWNDLMCIECCLATSKGRGVRNLSACHRKEGRDVMNNTNGTLLKELFSKSFIGFVKVPQLQCWEGAGGDAFRHCSNQTGASFQAYWRLEEQKLKLKVWTVLETSKDSFVFGFIAFPINWKCLD